MRVIEVGDGSSKRHNTGNWTVFAGGDGDVKVCGLVEGVRDGVLNFGCALAKISPFFGVGFEAVFVGAFSRPYDAAEGG